MTFGIHRRRLSKGWTKGACRFREAFMNTTTVSQKAILLPAIQKTLERHRLGTMAVYSKAPDIGQNVEPFLIDLFRQLGHRPE
jgi:hypothetical protein